MALNNIDLQILGDTYNLLPDYIVINQKATYFAGTQQSSSLFANERIKMSNQADYLQFKKAVKSSLKDAKEKIKKAKSSLNNLFTQLPPVYSEGDTFKQVEGLFKFISSEEGYNTEEATFQPTLGQVTLIEFWSLEQDPFMAQNLNMLEQNREKWQDKVEIIEIQVENQPYFVEKTIIDKKLDKLQHYMLISSESFRVHIQEPPFVFLLDKQRRIRYKGDPNKINLEEMINKYIEADVDSDEKIEEKQAQKEGEGKEKEELILLKQKKSQKLKAIFKNEVANIAKTMHQENISFNVEFIKTNKINRDGTKGNIEKSQISLSYEAEADQKQLIEQFLNDVWDKIPQDQRIIKKARINDVELDKKLIKEKFADAAKQIGISMSFGSQKVKTYKFANELCEFSLDEQLNHSVKCQLTAKDFNKWQNLLRKFVESYEKYEEQMEFINNLTAIIQENISIQLTKNDQFQTIDNYHKLDKVIEQITHKPSQVLVIEYWDKRSEQCADGILKNTLMLQGNAQKWGDKLRFVCLSLLVDYECKEFMEGIKKSQEFIEFYFPVQKDQPDYEKYGEGRLPHHVVVDKQGNIRAIGQVNNLEELINQLLNEEIQEGQGKVYLFEEQMNQIQTLLKSNQVKELLSGFNNQHTFTLQLKFEEEQYEGTNQEVFLKYNQPQLSYFVRKSQIKKLSLFLDQIYAIIGKDNFKIDESFLNTIDIPFPGKECVVCKKELNDQVQQYYSPFKNEFLCCECAEFDDKSKKGLARFKYTDTLIFINAPLKDLSVLKDIDDNKIGKNLKIDDDEEGRQIHDMCCNGCKATKEGPRYISASAKPGKQWFGGYVDYCAGCFEKLKNKDSEEAKKIVEKDAKYGMVSDSCLVRILFDVGYFDF